MMPETTKPAKAHSFPRRCHMCRRREMRPFVMPYRIEVLHDDVLHTVDIPALTVTRCGNCGELSFDNDACDQISDALRAQLHLLGPDQIRDNRTALKLSPEELSARIGMPPNTVGELEERLRIQSRALDNLLRVFFAVPQARAALDEAKGTPEFGAVVTTVPSSQLA